ncbi:MAG: hypothetical protein L6265_05330 [Thermoplasmatales archaeon]|nr:hypothetical protein [Thermoplasmatales archaeon]
MKKEGVWIGFTLLVFLLVYCIPAKGLAENENITLNGEGYESTIFNDTTIMINESLIVVPGISLSLINTTLLMEKNSYITVREGGKFFAENSTFAPKNEKDKWCGLDLSADSTLINCKISNGDISIYYGSVYDNTWACVINTTVIGGSISISPPGNTASITNTTIIGGGVFIDGGEYVSFENNTIKNSSYGLDLLHTWKTTIKNCALTSNTIGVRCWMSHPTIVNTTISSIKYDFYVARSSVKLVNTTFDENKIYFEDYVSKIILPDKTLTKEKGLDYYFFYYPVEVIGIFNLCIIGVAVTIVIILCVIFVKKTKRGRTRNQTNVRRGEKA